MSLGAWFVIHACTLGWECAGECVSVCAYVLWARAGGYNYIAFDIANHFCEYAGFDFDLEKWYPSKEAQVPAGWPL